MTRILKRRNQWRYSVLNGLAVVAFLTAFSLSAILSINADDNEENRIVHEIAPTKELPRNSEGAFVTLKSGRILFAYSQFYGGAADENAARIASIYSDDKGLTWSKDPQTMVETGAHQNVMSV